MSREIGHTSWDQQVRKFFDDASKEYADSYFGATPQSHYYMMRQQIVTSFLEGSTGARVLDVGCGPGMMAELCMRLGIHYTGLDISEKMIEECRRRHHNTTSATFCVGRIQNLPFEDNFFDVLLCMGAFEYVPAEEEDAAMAEMIRVIKPGGLLIISYLNRLSPYWLWDKHVYAKARTLKRLANRSLHRGGLDKPDAPPRYFTERECHKRMKSLHLKIIDTIYFGFNVFFRPLDRWLPRLAVWVSKKLNSQSRSPLRILAMAFIIVVQKAGYVGSDVVDLVLNLAEPTQGAVRATEHFRHSVE